MVDMVTRKTSSASSTFTVIDAGPDQTFMSDVIAVEKDLDFRDDVIYVGQTISTGGSPVWGGKLLRLTTNCLGGASCNTSPSMWGLSGNTTDVLEVFNDPDAVPATSRTLGPITMKPSAAIDDRNRLWLFAGSGRYYSTADKTDTSSQYLVGVRDPIMNGSTGTETPWCTGQTSATSCKISTLADVSNAVVCWVDGGTCIGSGASANQVTNVPGLTGGNFQSLLTLTGTTKQGWFSKLSTAGERSVGSPVILGGLVFYATFVPSTDPCVASGSGYLYGLYYVTGTAPSEPVFSGTSPGGTIATSFALGEGVTSTPSFHIGQGGVQADVQQSHGGITSVKTSMSGMWSRYISWIHQRD
jgi:type IV pilus assembly protein PilY1